MKQKSSKDQLSEFIYLYFHLHSQCNKIYIYFLEKFRTFGFILETLATVATDMHFCPQYMIIKACLDSCTFTICCSDHHLMSRNETGF